MPDTRLKDALARIPYASLLGVEVSLMGNEFTMILPYSENNIGNPVLPALHGGCIGGFMELTAISQLSLAEPDAAIAKPIGINIDYLRRGKPMDTFARAKIVRQGSRVAYVRVRAWQEDYDDPIAILHGHFMTASTDD